MATLFIGGWYSRCGECGKNADPAESHHIMETMEGDGCGAEFTEKVDTYVRVLNCTCYGGPHGGYTCPGCRA